MARAAVGNAWICDAKFDRLPVEGPVNLFDVTYAKVSRGPQNTVRIQFCGEPGYESCGAAAMVLSDSAQRSLRENLKAYAGQHLSDWDTRDHDQILVLDATDGEYAMWIPNSMSSGSAAPQSDDTHRLLLMHLRQGDYRNFLYIFVAILLLVAVGGLVVFRVRERQRRENVQIMFDLPTGVVREDPEGFIVDANDRAEEVLERRLPRSGFDRSRERPIKFERIFKRFVTEDFIDFDYKAHIVPLREQGVTSTYYALTHLGKWVRVTGSTILRADEKTEHFGVIEPAPKKVVDEIANRAPGEQTS